MVKEIADPMFKEMLPGPLATLHFTKVDLGQVPIVFSNVKVTKTPTDGIKLDLNVDWDGQCDISLDADMIPSVVSTTICPCNIRTNSFHRVSKAFNSMADSLFFCVHSSTSFLWYVTCCTPLFFGY